MNLDNIQIGWLTAIIICVVLMSIEMGYRLGHDFKKKYHAIEKESPVSVMSGSILGLLAFLLAFTFGIVYQRFETRKDIVRSEAGLMRSTIAMSDFMSEPEHEKTVRLLRKLVDVRMGIARDMGVADVTNTMNETKRIHAQLWNLGVANGRKDMYSGVTALYISSLREMINIQLKRATLAFQDRLPFWILMTLFLLVFFAMISHRISYRHFRLQQINCKYFIGTVFFPGACINYIIGPARIFQFQSFSTTFNRFEEFYGRRFRGCVIPCGKTLTIRLLIGQ